MCIVLPSAKSNKKNMAASVEYRSLFSYQNFVYASAGSAASVISMAMLYPLDTVRSILQIEDKRQSRNTLGIILEIIREDGILRLYRGVRSVLATLCISFFIYFYCYHGLKGVIRFQSGQNAIGDLVCAYLAGSINVLLTTPLWVVSTRMKFQGTDIKASWVENKEKRAESYDGIIDGLVKISRKEGLMGLWNGTVPSLILVFNPSIHFMVYEIQKRQAQFMLETTELPAFLYFVFGAVAKGVATLGTYPLQIIQARFRYKDKSLDGVTNPIVKSFLMLRNILKYQGVLGLYKGLEAKLLQTLLNAALMFLFYEEIASFVFNTMGMEFKR